MIEEKLLELLRAREINVASGCRPRTLTRGIDGLSEFRRQTVKNVRVRANADRFHLTEQDRQGHFHVGEE